jgi:D-serine deaminase-like pyridoxal phosphate-dependent protein
MVYVYIAGDKDGGDTYVGLCQSLLSMEWIAKYGVDNLLWYEGYPRSEAEQFRKSLSAAPEERRQKIFLRNNSERRDLSRRIWSSDEESDD